ncbi:MAG: BACON domain-containing protein [Candidatus Cryptobacteroides sp.]
MKRYFSIAAICISAFLGLASCTGSKEEETDPVKKDPVLKVPSAGKGVTAPAIGGEVKIAYSIENPTETGKFTASASVSWVSVDITSDKNNIVLTVDPNEGDERTAEITASYTSLTPVKVTLTQLAAGEEISISPDNLSFEFEGEELSGEVTVTSDRDWTLEGSASWVEVSATGGKSGDKVTFTAQANPDEAERTAGFVFKCGSKEAQLTVKQSGKPALDILGAIGDAVLRSLLLEKTDLDSDGVISLEEAAALKELVYIPEDESSAIASLAGLEYFNGLETVDLSKNTFAAADFSMMPALKSLTLNSCSYLESLNIEGCAALEELYCSFNKSLKSIVPAGCTSLKIFISFAGGLESVDLTGCPALESVTLYSNKLTTLDLSANRELLTAAVGQSTLESVAFPQDNRISSLSISGSSAITELDLAQFPCLVSLNVDDTKIKTLDLASCPLLERLSFQNCKKITKLDVSKNLALKSIMCYQSGLSSITMFEGQWENIQKDCLGISSYMVKTVPIEYPEDCASYITDDGLRSYILATYDADSDGKISGSEAESVKTVSYASKGLKSFEGFKYFRKIEVLDLSGNELESIDLGPFVAGLKDLNLKGNKLTAISLAGALSLVRFDVSDNLLASLTDLSGPYLPTLERVVASNNRLTSFGCSSCSGLKYVDLSNNELVTCNVEYSENIEELYLAHNHLNQDTQHFVRPFTLTSLRILDISYNDFELISSDVSWTDKWLSLESFDARGNSKLFSVDLSPIGETLSYIDVRECPRLSEITVNTLSPCKVLRDDNTTVIRK